MKAGNSEPFMCHNTGHNHLFPEIEMLTTPKRDQKHSIEFSGHGLAIQQTQEGCFPSDGLVAPLSAWFSFGIPTLAQCDRTMDRPPRSA